MLDKLDTCGSVDCSSGCDMFEDARGESIELSENDGASGECPLILLSCSGRTFAFLNPFEAGTLL